MAEASSASASGARRHSSQGADRKQTSAFRYSVSVMRTLGLELAMRRNLTLTVSPLGSYSRARAPFGDGAFLTPDLDTGASSTRRSPILSGAAALGETRVR